VPKGDQESEISAAGTAGTGESLKISEQDFLLKKDKAFHE